MNDSLPVFTLRDVTKTRTKGPGYSLSIPRLDIRAGSKVAITGPSGSGKSTFLDILGMSMRPDSMKTFILRTGKREVDVAAAWRSGWQDELCALRLRHMGYVLQTGGLLPYLDVKDNIGLSASLNNLPDSAQTVRDIAQTLGIERLLHSMPGQLSIGERQRVAIGRALASRPAVILADEPTAALDPYHAGIVLDLLLDAADSFGVTLILVTHDQDIVKRRGLEELRITTTHQQKGVIAILES